MTAFGQPERGTFRAAVARGIDTTQAMSWAFVQTLGEMAGFDALAQWGEEGVQRNIEEMMRNPPKVESWDDVNSLADLGTYFLEAVGENAPNLLAAMIPGIGAAAVVARTGAASTIGRATIGKAIKQRMPADAFEEYAKRRGQRIAMGAAAGAVSTGLNTGETRMEFEEHGIDNPEGALAAGVIKGALDVVGVDRIIQAARRIGVRPTRLRDVAVEALYQTGLTGTVEAATEGLQTVVDILAVKANDPSYDMFTIENLKEIREAVLKGGMAGGTFGGSISGITQMHAYRQHRQELRQQLDDFKRVTFESEGPEWESARSPMLREAASAIEAQYAAMLDPTSTKRAVVMTPGTPWPTEVQKAQARHNYKDGRATVYDTGDHVFAYETEAYPGAFENIITRDPELISQLQAEPEGPLSEQRMGEILGFRPEGKQGAEDGLVVSAFDKDGNPVSEMVTSSETIDRDVATAEGLAPEGGRVQIESPEDTITRRIEALLAEQGVEETAIPKVTDFVQRLPIAFQRDLFNATREGPATARRLIADLQEASALPDAQRNSLIQQFHEKFNAEIAADEEQIRTRGAGALTEMAGGGKVVNDMFAREQQNTPDAFEVTDAVADDTSGFRPGMQVQEPVVARLDGWNRGGRGWGTEKGAQKQLTRMMKTHNDPDAEFTVLEDNGKWWIEASFRPPVFSTQETLGRPKERNQTGYTKGLPEQAYREHLRIGDAVRKSVEIGEQRFKGLQERFGNIPNLVLPRLERGNPGYSHRAMASLIQAFDPDGNPHFLPAMELSGAGMDLLSARKSRIPMGQNEFRLAGLELMLGELHNLGWDVSQALYRPKDSGEGGSVSLRPDILMSHGVLKDKGDNAKDVRVEEALMERHDRGRMFGEINKAERHIKQLEKEIGESRGYASREVMDSLYEELSDTYDHRQKLTTELRERFPHDLAARAGVGTSEIHGFESASTVARIDQNASGRLSRLLGALQAKENQLAGIARDRVKKRKQGRSVTWHDQKIAEVQAERNDIQAKVDKVQSQIDMNESRRRQQETQGVLDVPSQRESVSGHNRAEERSARPARGRPVEGPVQGTLPLGGLQNEATRAKLTADDVRLIRSSTLPDHVLAQQFGVSTAAISHARTGRNRRQVRRLQTADRAKLAERLDTLDSGSPEAAKLRKQIAEIDADMAAEAPSRQARSPLVEPHESDTVLTQDPLGRHIEYSEEASGQKSPQRERTRKISERIDDRIDRLTKRSSRARQNNQKVLDGYDNRIEALDRSIRALEAKNTEGMSPKAKLRHSSQLSTLRSRRSNAQAERAEAALRDQGVVGFGESITQSDVDFVDAIFQELGMDLPVTILDLAALDLTRGAAMTDGRAAKVKERFAADPRLRATTFRTKAGPVIVVRNFREDTPAPAARAMRTLILGHEAGHHVLDAVVDQISPEMRKRLKAAHAREAKSTGIDTWQGEKGFKEWFADKVAARARALSDKPTNAVDRIFRDAARTLTKLWDAIRKKLPARFRANKAFDNFIQQAKQQDLFDTTPLLHVIDNQLFEDMTLNVSPVSSHVSAITLSRAMGGLRKVLNGVINTPGFKLLFTRDGRLRAIPGAKRIADMLFQQTNTNTGVQSYQDGVTWSRRKWIGEFDRIMKGKDAKDVDQALQQLSRELPTDQLSPLAKELRAYLDRYYQQYLKPRVPWLKNEKHYFPRAYAIPEIAARPQEFIDILTKHGVDQDLALEAMQSMVMPSLMTSSQGTEGWMKQRVWTGKPDMIVELVDKGFLNKDPMEGIRSYIYDSTRRAEWDRLFGGLNKNGKWDKNAKLLPLLNDVAPNRRAEALSLIETTIHPKTPNPLRAENKLLSELKAYESFRVLWASGIATIPELAGVYTRAKGEMGLVEFTRVIGASIKNWSDVRDFGQALGVLRQVAGHSAATEMYVDPNIGSQGIFFSKHLPKMMKWNGNDMITNFSRALGLAVARTFIVQQAQHVENGGPEAARAKRYLEELGVKDHRAILRWNRDGQLTWTSGLPHRQRLDADVAGAALSRFVDESVIHPNSSERTTWAEHPVAGLFWHLKQFAVSFNKNILGGVYREIENRAATGDAGEVMRSWPWLAAAGFLFLALGGASDELRNRVFTLGERGTWRANRRDPERMVSKWIDRAGFTSMPYYDLFETTLSGNVPKAKDWAYAAGPTTSHVYSLFLGSGSVERKFLHSIPLVSQSPVLRRHLYDVLNTI